MIIDTIIVLSILMILGCLSIFIYCVYGKAIGNIKMDWSIISQDQRISEDFVKKQMDKINWNKPRWNTISQNQKLSEDFVKKQMDKINWNKPRWNIISQDQRISEEFINNQMDKIDLKIDDEFINSHENYFRRRKNLQPSKLNQLNKFFVEDLV